MSHPDNHPEIRMCGTERHPAKEAISKTPETDALIPSQTFVDQTRLFDREYFIPLLDKSRSLETRLRQAEADLSDERAKNEMAEHKLVVEREALKADLVKARAAIIAMALDGWLYHGPEGMSDAQEKCLAAYNETDHGKAALAKHKL